MAESTYQRAFAALASFSLGRARAILAVTLLLIVGSGALIPGLSVSTSRYGLVSDDDPYQARMNRFFERFGRPDAPIMLISGGTPAERQAAVDRIRGELEGMPALAGRILARTGPADAAEVLALQKPEALAEALTQVPPGIDLATALEGGLPAWAGALAGQLTAGLDSEEAPVRSPEEAAAGLRGLASAADLLGTTIQGGDPLATMAIGEEFRRSDVDERGYLITADGENHVITMFPELAGDEVTELRPLVESIRAARDRAMEGAPAGLSARLSGLPAISVDENDVLRRGLLVSSAASAIGILLLCLLLFRSLRQTILALMPLFGGTVISLGLVRLIVGELNIVTSGFISVLLGLGIDFSVHVVSRINEERRQGVAIEPAIREAVVQTGPGILSAAAITTVAFLATTTTDFTAYGELGVITSMGLAVIVVVTLVAFPALLKKTTAPKNKASPEAPGMRALPGLLRRARWVVLIAAVGLGVAGGFALPKIGFNSRTFDFLPTSSESVSALAVLEPDPVMSPMYANVSAPSVAEARAMAEKLRAFKTVASVQTATDLLPPLTDERLAALRKVVGAFPRMPDFAVLEARRTTPEELAPKIGEIVDALDEIRFALRQAGQDTAAADEAHAAFTRLRDQLQGAGEAERARLAAIEPELARLLRPALTTAKAVAERGAYAPTDLPALLRRRFVSRDGESLALFVVPNGNPWLGTTAEPFTADVESVDPTASGLAIQTHIHEVMIIGGFRRAAAIAAGLVLLLLILDLRGLRGALFALVPTILGWLWMLALMAALGMSFNVANIVCLPLVLGIGTAFGVHMMHRADESAGRNGGHASLDDVVRGTGGAVIISALTTMVGFAALMLGEHGAMQSLGLSMVIGLGTCLVASVFVLPALLSLLGRAR